MVMWLQFDKGLFVSNGQKQPNQESMKVKTSSSYFSATFALVGLPLRLVLRLIDWP